MTRLIATCSLLLGMACISQAASPGHEDTTDPSVQTIYREHIPHIANNGEILLQYDPNRSFFMIGQWGVPESRIYKGIDYRWHQLVEAGYNTVWPWLTPGYTSERQLEQAEAHGLKVILMRRHDPQKLQDLAESKSLLGVVWQDEPMVNFSLDKQAEQLKKFEAFRDMAERVAPRLPVFVNTSPWMIGNGRTPWIEWHRASDVSCHDNYVIWPDTRSINLGSYGKELNGIADSVSLAVKVSKQQKPVWLIVGAFEADVPDESPFPFRYPTSTQLRAMVYAGFIHGTTGIVYYAWDSNITRFGMSPQGHRKIPGRPDATRAQADRAKELWQAAAEINHEIDGIIPALLSKTASQDEVNYRVTVRGEAITDTPIRTLLKTHPDGGYLLLLVNMDNADLATVIDLDRPLSEVEHLLHGQWVSVGLSSRDQLSLDCPAFSVHVMRLRFGSR